MMLASEAAMQAEIIAVGSELLLGQIVDTNLAFIAKEFAAAGLDLYYKIAVVDIRIAAKGTDAADADRMIEPVEAEIRQRLGDIVFGVDEDTLEGQITERNASRLRAGMVVEAANGPTTAAADAILAERGVYLVPDILANAGGVIVSYFEWVQDLQSFFWEESEVNQRLQRIISAAFAEVTAVAEARSLRLREAAYVVALQRVVDAIRLRGIYP